MDANCKLGRVADHALNVQCTKLGFSLEGLPGEKERPFNPSRVLYFPKPVTRENATFPKETSDLHL